MAISVLFHELEGSGASQHSIDRANSATRMFLIRWEDRIVFLTEIATSPHPIWGPTCAVNSVQIQPFSPDTPPSVVVSDPTTQDVSYLQNSGFNCLVIIQYNTDFSLAPWPCDIPKPTIPAGTEMVLRTRASTQVLRLPPRKFVSASNPNRTTAGYVPDPDGPEGRIIIPTSEFQLQWYYVDEPPIATWEDDFQGRVNETTFLGSEPETILFEGFDVEPSTQFIPTDPFSFTVTAHFRKRRIVDDVDIRGWNHEFEIEGWQRVQMKDGAGVLRDRYLKVDFSSMFAEAACGSSSSSSSSSGV